MDFFDTDDHLIFTSKINKHYYVSIPISKLLRYCFKEILKRPMKITRNEEEINFKKFLNDMSFLDYTLSSVPTYSTYLSCSFHYSGQVADLRSGMYINQQSIIAVRDVISQVRSQIRLYGKELTLTLS
jgi:hypothetical protein